MSAPSACSPMQARETALSESPGPFAVSASVCVDGAFSEDTLLGGKVRLRQPVDGYRAAIDPVLLAASLDAAPGQRVLEAGTGHGAAAICLGLGFAEWIVTGFEIQP